MRTLLLIAFVFVGASALATLKVRSTDKEIGPVVAIQREIPDLQNNCLKNIVGETDKPMFVFSCRLSFTFDLKKEFIMTPNPIAKFSEEGCSVETNYAKGNLVLIFGNTRAPSTLDEAKVCLEKGTNSFQNKINLLVFKAPQS